MLTELFDYSYPASCVAQEPLSDRTGSKLMVVDRSKSGGTTRCRPAALLPPDNPLARTGEARSSLAQTVTGPGWEHRKFSDLPRYLQAGDLLVLNNTKVLPIRLQSGPFEILLLPPLPVGEEPTPCLVRPLKKAKPGMRFEFSSHLEGELVKVGGDGPNLIRLITSGGTTVTEAICEVGLPPLPPYIRRQAADPRTPLDRERYQTVFAKTPGSSAAPTAGLHFTDQLLDEMSRLRVEIIDITLHVGWDTFRPVREDKIGDHQLHGEDYFMSAEAAAAINRAKTEGRRIVACGTTTVRCLESAWDEVSGVRSGSRSTRLFITPGFKFRIVNAMITNFHQPRSTLLMLVAAFAGREKILAAYAEAIQKQYRLFSYGDAMLIL